MSKWLWLYERGRWVVNKLALRIYGRRQFLTQPVVFLSDPCSLEINIFQTIYYSPFHKHNRTLLIMKWKKSKYIIGTVKKKLTNLKNFNLFLQNIRLWQNLLFVLNVLIKKNNNICTNCCSVDIQTIFNNPL